ncbi:MAG: hypothetical protein WDO56_05955 [Gammaproteobacteria bacterium]
MATPIGTYSFLSYLRIGLANKISQPDQDPIKLRASFDVQLNLEGQAVAGGAPLTQPITKPVQLYAPGDIVGIEPRAIFKTEPLNWITNFESNYLPYVDFYEEDFPWRYTPARPDETAHRLRPWITLVVLEEGEFKDGANVKDKPLPYIQVDSAATKFPPAEQLWAWAHVHVNADMAASDMEAISINMGSVLPKLASNLKSNADVAYSRLLCPRKLKPNAAYHAFIIPTFETGRRAGLGLAVESDFATQSAWGVKPDQNEFPYYHRWFFRTGTLGDFEYLVRLLKAKPADERVGRRDMDMQDPGWNLPGLAPDGPLGGILRLGGALRVPLEVIKDIEDFNKYEHWADVGYPQPIQRAIARFVNLADDYQKPGVPAQPIPDPDLPPDPDPLITPPLYGRWHAAVERLLTDAGGATLPNNRNWIHELNLDPRFRVSAGFGTRVIQKHQEEYMNVAWEQIGDVLDVNRFIRLAQLMREALWQWHTRQLQPLLIAQPDKLMMLSAPVQKRILVQNSTISYQLKASFVPPVAVSAQMRKILRPRGRVVTRLAFAAQNITPHSLITRLNTREVLPAPVKQTPPALVTEAVLADQLQPPPQPQWLVDLLRQYPWFPSATLGLAILVVVLLALFSAGAFAWVLGVVVVGGLVFAYRQLKRLQQQLAQPQIFKDGAQTPAIVEQAPKSPDFRITTAGETFRPTIGTVDSAEAQRFKAAVKDLYAVDIAARAAAYVKPKTPLDLRAITTQVVATLHPNASVPRLVLNRILLPERFRSRFDLDLLNEVMNYPRFDLPMYKPLSDLNTEYFLPNLNLIEPNSITLLETNQKFIESYMVGLNHEMARELLWREYPTDQRGSYFRQFWDVSGYLPEKGDDLATLAEKLKDIPELHRWRLDSPLGDHDNREVDGAREEEIVLVIRGELLKRYPTAVIYAHKAQWQMKKGPGGKPTTQIDNTVERVLADIPVGLEDNPPRTLVKMPLYSAKIDPDIYFFGFDLTSEVARGTDGSHPGDATKPGWFFVIKERPGEPRFGLDIGGPNAVKHTWSDLAWEDAAPGLAEGGFLQITGATPLIGLKKPIDQTQAEYAGELAQYDEDVQVIYDAKADAADLAYVLFQVPVMVAVHASEMLTIK